MRLMVGFSSAWPPIDANAGVVDIQEYLLLKGVEAVAIHGSKSAFYSMHSLLILLIGL